MTTHATELAARPESLDRRRSDMSASIKVSAEWERLAQQVQRLAPEAFGADRLAKNLLARPWRVPTVPAPLKSPIDGRTIGILPMADESGALLAIQAASEEATAWRRTPLRERRRRVEACIAELQKIRELLALLLVWEIGKPFPQGLTEVERTIGGVRWYVEQIEEMMADREPLGLIATVASWNYPLSVLFQNVMVQVLAGNAAIAKVPTSGGLYVLTLCFSISRRHGLPVSLVSGSGATVGRALTTDASVAGLVFVGGRDGGAAIARQLQGTKKRSTMELEGVNSYGVWEFSDWAKFREHVRKGFEYGKQRCTAYTRFVVQRRLVPDFIESYLDTVRALRIGNPLAVTGPDDPLPNLDFGPMISAGCAHILTARCEEAVAAGAIPIFQGTLDDRSFVAGQDRSAYLPPRALLNVPRNSSLYHREPFGPVDSIVVVDSEQELIAEMNVSGGALVATLASDDTDASLHIAEQLSAFKVGINRLRSRGDRDEPFGGAGRSWSGALVGGSLLVDAVTNGPRSPLGSYGHEPLIE